MDDQQGNLIDGTARARQWRRSRSKAGGAGDPGGEARSEAPKRIASSLLVPADMVDGTLEPASGGLASGLGEPGLNGEVADGGGLSLTDPSANSASSNVFLSPDAAVIDQARQRSYGWSKAARLAELVASAPGRVMRLWVTPLAKAPRRTTLVTGRGRTAAVALCLVSVTVVVAAVIAAQPTHTRGRSRLDQSATSAAPFDRIKSVLLSSVASAMAADHAIPPAHSSHPVRRHPAIRRESRSRTPSSTTKLSPPPTTTSYAASSSGGSTASTSAGSGDSGATSTTPSGATSSPVAQPATAGNGPTTAFGASGALGPGSSPNG